MNQIETDGSELSEMAQEPSVIRLVNEILREAIDLRPATYTSSRSSRESRSVTGSTECSIRSRCRRRSAVSRRRSSAA